MSGHDPQPAEAAVASTDETQRRQRSITRRRLARVGIPAVVAVAAGTVVALAQLGDDGADTFTDPAVTTPTEREPDDTDTAVPTAETDVQFDAPSTAAPGEVIEISGTACPPAASWDVDTDHWVVIGAGERSGRAVPTINDPIEGGHVSFNLLPEYRDTFVAEATPAADGTWTATWTVPESESNPVETWLTAVCIGGSGLEAGTVHYGSHPLTIAPADEPIGAAVPASTGRSPSPRCSTFPSPRSSALRCSSRPVIVARRQPCSSST